MSQRTAQSARIETIDRMIRELTWHGQKHAIQTLTRPEIGLTMPQMVTLLAIYDSGSCRMGDLADATQQSGGTLTGIVDRLIVDGLVERVRSEGGEVALRVFEGVVHGFYTLGKLIPEAREAMALSAAALRSHLAECAQS